MLRPILFVGLGGAGGKTIRSIKQSISEKFDEVACSVDVSEVFQFLHIDMTMDGMDYDAPMLTPDEVMILAEPGKTYESYLADLVSQFPNEVELSKALGGWAKVKPGISDGRSIARVIALSRLKAVDSCISEALQNLKNVSIPDLAKLAVSLGYDSRYVEHRPSTLIFSSMGGNTGSAIYQDIIEMIWSKEGVGSADPVSFLFTNDVFDLNVVEESRMSSNSMSFLSEISQGRDVSYTQEFDFLYENINISNSTNHANLADLPKFLISGVNEAGRKPPESVGGSGHATFAELGFEIGQIFLQPRLIEELFNRIVMLGYKPLVERNLLLSSAFNARTSPRFLTFGYAKLSVGFDSLVEYVTDALTRSQIQTLLYPNFSRLPNSPTGTEMPFEEVIESRAESIWPGLLNRTGLGELRDERVSLEILGSQDPTLPEKFSSSVLEGSEFAQEDMSGTEYAKLTWVKWHNLQPKYIELTRRQLDQDLKSWVDRVQRLIVDEIAQIVSTDGLNVGCALLRKLIDEVTFVTQVELSRDVESKSKSLSVVTPEWWQSQVYGAMAGKPTISARDTGTVAAIQSKLERWCEIKTQLEVLTGLHDVVLELARGPLAALETSLKTAAFRLMEQVIRDGSLETLPDWEQPVPAGYGARFGQVELLEACNYQDIYQSLVIRDLPIHEKGSFWQRSIAASLLGVPLYAHEGIGPESGRESVQNLIVIENNWIPSSLRGDWVGDSAAVFKTRHSVEDLKSENWSWACALDSVFGTSGLASIRSYVLDRSHEIRGYREGVFLSKLGEVLTKSEPPSLLNQESMPHYGGLSASGKFTNLFPRLPFGPNDSIYERLVRMLQSYGFDMAGPHDEISWLDPTNVSGSFTVVTVRGCALPFYAFWSVTGPAVKTKGPSARFARSLGRSRPLLETIPVGPGVRSSLFTGWLVANAFGLINTETEVLGQQRAQIWNPTLEQSAGFSDFIVVNIDKVRGAQVVPVVLPAILSGITLALSEYGSSGRTAPLEAFEFLLYVGREVTYATGVDDWSCGDGQLLPNGERHRSTYLSDWIRGTSDNPFNTPNDISSPMANAPGTRIARKTHLATYLKEVYSELSLLMVNLDALPWSEKPAIWEIGRALLDDLAVLQKFVDDFQDEDRPSLLEG